MKRSIAALAALACVGVASAQSSVSGSQATGAAYNSGISLANYFGGSTIPAATTSAQKVDHSGLPANVQLTAIAPPPSPRTCADTGFAGGGGNKSGGLTLAFGTGAEEGCDVGRDIEMVAWAFKLPVDSVEYKFAIQRLCSKKTIKASMDAAGEGRRCETAEQRQQRAEAVLSDRPQVALSSDPLIRARQLGQ